jgi:hypothetical protein
MQAQYLSHPTNIDSGIMKLIVFFFLLSSIALSQGVIKEAVSETDLEASLDYEQCRPIWKLQRITPTLLRFQLLTGGLN